MQLHEAPFFFKSEGHVPLTRFVDRKTLYIDGAWSAPSTRQYAVVINPATEETIGSAPEAGPEDAERAIRALKRVEQGREQDSSARAKRMPHRDRSTVDVDALLVNSEPADQVKDARSEGLVDLPHVDIAGGQFRVAQGALDRRDTAAKQRRAYAAAAVRDDARSRLTP